MCGYIDLYYIFREKKKYKSEATISLGYSYIIINNNSKQIWKILNIIFFHEREADFDIDFCNGNNFKWLKYFSFMWGKSKVKLSILC